MRKTARVTGDRLDPAKLMACVDSPGCGAQALFIGVVRDDDAGRKVRAVSYDAFKPLAEKTLAAIVSEAGKRWRARVAAAHRTGRLAVGEASIVIAAAAPHRAEAFEACRYVIEEVKRRLPVWKKEHYARGSGRWLAGHGLSSRP